MRLSLPGWRAILALAFVAHLAQADSRIYKWVDGSGRVHYGQAPPPSGAERLQVRPSKPAAEADHGASAAAEKPRRGKRGYRDRLAPIAAGDLKAVKTLFATGIEMNAGIGRRRLTPAVYAASQGQVEILDYLIKRGADLSLPDGTGHRMMTAAARAGAVDVMLYLKELGVPVDSRHKMGGSALLWAAKEGRIEAVDWLLRQGAGVSLRDNQGRTPLMAAVERGDAGMVSRLLESGARPRAVNTKGRSAMDLASAQADIHILALLNRDSGEGP